VHGEDGLDFELVDGVENSLLEGLGIRRTAAIHIEEERNVGTYSFLGQEVYLREEVVAGLLERVVRVVAVVMASKDIDGIVLQFLGTDVAVG